MASTIKRSQPVNGDATAQTETRLNFQRAADDIEALQKGTLSFGTNQTLTGPGAVDIISALTLLVSTGTGNAITLADGAEGQEKIVLFKTRTGGSDTMVLTPAHFHNGSTITFNSAGDVALLKFLDGKWACLAQTGCVIA